MYGLKKDWVLEKRPRVCVLEDYQGGEARWCPGCGDHAVLNSVQRVARDLQLPPEKTVVVSGIEQWFVRRKREALPGQVPFAL